MAALPAFERRADRVQYVMLENKKKDFGDQKEAGKLPHVTVLENWRRQLVARNEDDEDFQEVIQRTADEFREKDGKALKRANDELVAALKAARAQVGQPDPLAAEAVKNWIEKEKRKQREGEGRVTRSGRRIGGEAVNVPAVVTEQQVMIEIEQFEIAPAIEDIPIGVPLGPEMLQALDALLLDVHLVDDEVQKPVDSSSTNRNPARSARVAEEVRRSQRLSSVELAVDTREQEHPEVIEQPITPPRSPVDAAVRRLRESFSALAVTTPKAEPPVDGVPEEQEDVQLDELEVNQKVEEEEVEEQKDTAAEEAPMRSTRRNPKRTERYQEYMATMNLGKQPANVQPVQDAQHPGLSQPSHDANQRPTRNKEMPQKLNDFILY
ncbi:unnamed protein product [Caenorhabditis brenneri]